MRRFLLEARELPRTRSAALQPRRRRDDQEDGQDFASKVSPGYLEHPSSFVSARMLMRAFAPAHYPAVHGRFSHGGDISLVNYDRERASVRARDSESYTECEIYTTFTEWAARPDRSAVRCGAGARCQAESNETPRCAERSASSSPLSLFLSGARTSCGQRPGQARSS